MMITICEIVVIMLLALFFPSCNCREMPIEAQLRKWSLQPAVLQYSRVLASYANVEAIAKPRGGNDLERRFIEPLGEEENTAGTPEVHLSLKRSLFIESGTRPSMKMGYQNNFSGTQEAKSSGRTFGNIPETSKARPINEAAVMTPPQPQAVQDVEDVDNAMDYAPAHKKPPIHN